jgi:hypothetical protein
MDLAYNYHLTYAMSDDFEHRLSIDLDPSLGQEPLVLPEPGMRPGIRRQRLYQLTRSAAPSGEDDAREGVVPRAVAAGMLAQHGVDQGTHRLRVDYYQPAPPPNTGSFLTAEQTGYRNGYDANLVFFGGEMGLVRRAPTGEVSPVVNER